MARLKREREEREADRAEIKRLKTQLGRERAISHRTALKREAEIDRLRYYLRQRTEIAIGASDVMRRAVAAAVGMAGGRYNDAGLVKVTAEAIAAGLRDGLVVGSPEMLDRILVARARYLDAREKKARELRKQR